LDNLQPNAYIPVDHGVVLGPGAAGPPYLLASEPLTTLSEANLYLPYAVMRRSSML